MLLTQAVLNYSHYLGPRIDVQAITSQPTIIEVEHLFSNNVQILMFNLATWLTPQQQCNTKQQEDV